MGVAQKALDWTLTKLGCKYSQTYRWGVDPDIFDCSSLVYRAYQAAGYTFKSGSTSNTEANDTAFDLIYPASRSVLGNSFTSVATLKTNGYVPQAGDVIYLCTNSSTTRSNKITHVVMVKDANTIVHARGTSYGVREDSINLYGTKVVAVARYKEEATSGEPINTLCTGSSVNIRKGPGTSYAVLTSVDRNHPLVRESGSGSWAHVVTIKDSVAYDGYMSTTYLDD